MFLLCSNNTDAFGRASVSLFYRVRVFGVVRGPWRATLVRARRDALEAGVGSYDEDQRFFLDAAANIESVHEYELMRSGEEYPGSYRRKPDPVSLSVRRQA